MTILVLCSDYPSKESIALQFVHVRNIEYQKNGIDVTVLNFSADHDYIQDGIKVISFQSYIDENGAYDVLICHAPNIRNHYFFLKKFGNRFKNNIFFFHGHEIVKIGKTYPLNYDFFKNEALKRVIQSIYDVLKLKIWKRYFNKIKPENLRMVFVSESLKKDFFKYVKADIGRLKSVCYIINNSVSEVFEFRKYNAKSKKDFDYITIRSNIDSSVYCIDLITRIAKKNPNKRFLLIGKGDYFKHYELPSNIVHLNKALPQEELLCYIDRSRFALMPTRRDSQGVMASELATYGIPLITSNLPVCKEMFQEFSNVIMMPENELVEKIGRIDSSKLIYRENKKFYKKNTIKKEIELIISFDN